MIKTKPVRLALTFLLGLGLIAGLFHFQHLSLSLLFAQKIDFFYLNLTLLVSIIYVASGAWKWQLISQAWFGKAAPFRVLFRQSALTVFWSQFLPLPIATALQRTAMMKTTEGKTIGEGLIHSAYDLGFDFGIVLILILCSLAQIFWHFSFAAWLGLGLCGSLLAFGLIGCSGFLLHNLGVLCERFSLTRRATFFLDAWQEHGLLQPRFMALMMGLGIFRFFLITLRLGLCASALGLDLSWQVLAYASPLSVLPSLVPITPANLGVAEWTWTYLLLIWGIPTASSALFATLLRITLLLIHALLPLFSWRQKSMAKA